MKQSKNTVLKTVAKIGMVSAVKSCGSASRWLCHEPKVPVSLKKLAK